MPKIYYEKKGKGPACILLHGGPGLDSSYFRPFLDPLAKRLSLYFLDSRGCGRAPRLDPSQYTLAGMIEDIEQLRVHEGIERFVLFGHSFGGLLALRYALLHPQAITALILISTAADTSFAAAFQKNIDRYPEVVHAQRQYLLSQRSDANFKKFLLGNIAVNFADPIRSRAREVIARIQPSAACFEQLKLTELRRFAVSSRLGEIRVPTLVIAGAADLVVPPSYSQQLANGIPGAVFVEIAAAGHFPFIENQQEFVKVVEEWLPF